MMFLLSHQYFSICFISTYFRTFPAQKQRKTQSLRQQPNSKAPKQGPTHGRNIIFHNYNGQQPTKDIVSHSVSALYIYIIMCRPVFERAAYLHTRQNNQA